MKFNFSKHVLAVVGTVVICAGLNGCSSSNDTDDSDSGTSAFISKVYELKGEDDCSTQPQKVMGRNNQDLRENYCAHLQDGAGNNHCAESQRLELFLKDCSEKSWCPVENSEGLNRKQRAEIEVTGGPVSFQISSNLGKLEVSEAQFTANLNSDDLALGQSLFEKMKSCGLTSECLVSMSAPGYGVTYNYVRWPNENSSALVVVIDSSHGPLASALKPVYIVMKYKDQDTNSAPTVEVYREIYTRGFRTYKEFFNHGISSQKLFTASADFKSGDVPSTPVAPF